MTALKVLAFVGLAFWGLLSMLILYQFAVHELANVVGK